MGGSVSIPTPVTSAAIRRVDAGQWSVTAGSISTAISTAATKRRGWKRSAGLPPTWGCRSTASLGPSNGNGQPYQVREWTYRNALTGEKAVQVVERYDGACWRKDCLERFVHKHPWLRREEKWRGWPTDGFLLLEHVPQASDLSEKTLCAHGGDEISCTSCTSCTTTTVLNENSALRDWAIIAEGETTAEAAAACGYRAFSYQGGSNGAGKADYLPRAGPERPHCAGTMTDLAEARR